MKRNEHPRLLPCPFCGDEDTPTIGVNRTNSHYETYEVICTKCYLRLIGEPPFKSRDAAVSAWNHRAEVKYD